MAALPDEARVYTERASEGLARLDAILTRMSEATRLEHLVRESQRERFDAREVLRGCASGYAWSFRTKFALSVPTSRSCCAARPTSMPRCSTSSPPTRRLFLARGAGPHPPRRKARSR